MESFTPFESLTGGLLIGLASALMLVVHGRIAGISGISGGLVGGAAPGDRAWRGLFVAGLAAGGFAYSQVFPEAFAFTIDRSWTAMIVAGVLVGFGTQLGNGCTSGHGVCGLSRFSARSLVAVATFMAFAGLTVFLVGSVFGGSV